MNEIHYQIDHDFRNLTKLVWHFCDFSTLFGGIMKFLQIRKRKKGCTGLGLGPTRNARTWPSGGWRPTWTHGPGGSGAHARPQAMARDAVSMAQTEGGP